MLNSLRLLLIILIILLEKKIEINILLIKIEDKNHYNKIKNDNRSFEPNYPIKNLLFWTGVKWEDDNS